MAALVRIAVDGSLAGVAQTAMTILDEVGDVGSHLVHDSSGGVGSITVQIARSRGIDVVATASARSQNYLAELGASPVEYGPGLLRRLEAAHPALFDASIDMSGKEEATQASIARVKPGGLIGSIAGVQSSSDRVQTLWTKRSPAKLKAVVDGVAEGRFRWEVSKTIPSPKRPKLMTRPSRAIPRQEYPYVLVTLSAPYSPGTSTLYLSDYEHAYTYRDTTRSATLALRRSFSCLCPPSGCIS